MARKSFFERPIARGYKANSSIVNNEELLSPLQPVTKENHQRQLQRWADFMENKNAKSPIYDCVKSAYVIETLKEFIREQAIRIKGTKGQEACVETVRNYWNTFTGAWKRLHDPIPDRIISIITQFIYGPLQKELNLRLEKKFRRYPSGNHLHRYAIQFWGQDFHVYRRPSTRVNDWALFLSNVFSTARIGEYIESTARRGSERGLYYRDLMFICFRNGFNQPELAIQLTKDAKNMSNEPASKRPTHALAEGDEPHLLCFNALLPYLSRLLSLQAFRDHSTIQSLLSVEPPEKVRSCQIHWRDDLLETPFFLSQSRGDCIEKADAFSRRSGDLGIRAGCREPPTQHDWRAEGLFQTDKYYTEATRMRQAAQTNREIYGTNYQPSNPGVDGQALWTGAKRREEVNDAFREMSIPYNPNLSQRLPARKQYELQNSTEYLEVQKEIASIQAKRSSDLNQLQDQIKVLRAKRGPQSVEQLEEMESLKAKRASDYGEQLKPLQNKNRAIWKRALEEWQKDQPYYPNAQQDYHRRMFSRVRFMMPERDRLARNLFKEGTLRDPVGLSVLEDMVKLQQQPMEVMSRPGLEPPKCQCSRRSCDDIGHYDWEHVYNCHKEYLSKKYGSADFCFLCHEWHAGADWDTHCEEHCQGMSGFPVYFDHLVYAGVLANPGYCPFCLRNESLPSRVRMKQFIYRETWLAHIHKHMDELRQKQGAITTLSCIHPEPECPREFQSVLDLEFHLQDIHGLDMPKPPKLWKKLEASSGDLPPTRKRQRCTSKEQKEDEIDVKDVFVNTSVEVMSKRLRKRRKVSINTHVIILDSNLESEDEPQSRSLSCSTAFSGDTLIDPDLLTSPKALKEKIELPISNIIEIDLTQLEDVESKPVQGPLLDYPVAKTDSSSMAGKLKDTCDESSAPISNERAEGLGDVTINESSRVTDSHEETEYDVEDVVRKGRIGQRVYFKIKWSGWPSEHNSWVRRNDVGVEARGLWDSKKQAELRFKDLVSKEIRDDGSVWYEASWHDQNTSENIWVQEWELSSRVIDQFEAERR